MVVFWMIYEHQINWANAYDTNLYISISRLIQNERIDVLSTTTLLVSWHVQIRKCVPTVKIELIHTISYELHEYIHCCIPSISSVFLLILLL